jgi:hypothetical protein
MRSPARLHGLALLALLVLAGCGGIEPGRLVDRERLLNAIAADDAGFVGAALAAGAVHPDARIPAPGYLEGTPLLTLAAKYGAIEVLRLLVRAGADVNARTPVDETALMLACFFMEEGVRGAEVSERHEQAARILVAAGADLEGAPHGYTALSYAAYQGRDRTVRFLLERGARVNGYAVDGIAYIPTPLMMAAMMGHRSTVLALLAAGADPRIRVHLGHTARELALKHGHTQIARILACAEAQRAGSRHGVGCE